MTPEQLAARVLADVTRYAVTEYGMLSYRDGVWIRMDDALAAIARHLAPGDDLVERLETKAAMIALGEKIAWGSDSAIMQEAAARISALTAERDRRTEMHECAMSERDDATLYADEQKARAEAAEAEAATLRDRLARIEGALRGVMVGGNHLAIWLPEPCPPVETEPLAALEQIGAVVYYDVWCCWRSIMQARAALTETPADGGSNG